jgi:hypothetical protein
MLWNYQGVSVWRRLRVEADAHLTVVEGPTTDKREVQVPILPWQTQHGRARKRFGAIHHLSCHYYGDAWISARWGQVRFSQIVKIEEAPEGAERVT